MNATLLLLADGRFPSGGHAHSAGTEPAVGVGDVHDIASLRAFVVDRIETTGRVDAAFAAAACAGAADPGYGWLALEAEYLARTASPRLRLVSRTLGRQLLRGGERVWPTPTMAHVKRLFPLGAVQPLAMGIVAAAAGCAPMDAALCELHHLIGSLVSGAVRLLGLDPFEVAATSASFAPRLDVLAAKCAAMSHAEPRDLPADVTLLTDVLAEHHSTWEVRLFAS